MRILVVAAHPDDEVLGCGGTLARLAREGADCYVAVLGEGITSRHSSREEADPALVEALECSARKAAQVLGAKDLFTHRLPDNRFDTVPMLDIVKIVEALADQLRPDIIYTHHAGDLNVDHQVTNRAVLTATRPTPGQPVREVYAFEAASSTEWAFGRPESAFCPNVFVDVSKTLDVKLKALVLYESEARSFPHPRSPDAVRSAARRWGSVAGCEAAEAFELVRMLR